MEEKKKRRSVEIEEVLDEDAPQGTPYRPDPQKLVSCIGLPTMEEKKKRRGVEIEEVLDEDAPQGTRYRPQAGAPPKEHSENDAKVCDCRWQCPEHSPQKLKLKPMPCGHMMGGRNLVVCIDGTANQFGEKNTNVIELYNLVLKEMGDNQHTWYNSGIGTYARPHWRSLRYWQQTIVHKIDLAIAWNFELTVQAAYRWLADNYQEGDCIFLFGFSRGAFQVRALAGMIDKVGLIHKGNEVQIPFAYELYADPKSGGATAAPVGTSPTDKKVSMAERFKEAFSRKNVIVHFVGAWDTVSSIGVARGKRVLPGTTDGMTHVCYFRHALALDERRVKFLPEYAWGGTTLPPPDPEPESDTKEKPKKKSHGDRLHPQVLEIWFPGTHSDIGGGNAINAGMDRSRPPLRWMASQAAELGLRIGPFKRELSQSEQIEFRESLTGLWHLFEMLPLRRLTFSRSQPGIKATRMPHLWSRRKIHEGQKIHYSFVLGKTETSEYVPKARPPLDDRSLWDTLRNEPLQNSTELLEIETFYRVADAVRKILADMSVDYLVKQISSDETGPQFFYDEVIETIRSWEGETELELNAKCRLLSRTAEILQRKPGSIQLRKWSDVRTPLVELLKSGSDEDRKVAETFLGQYTKDVNCLYELREHSSAVLSVAISPDGKRIVSGSYDNTIRIWDMETGEQVGEPLRRHDDDVNAVAISPNGKFIVSGSDDQTIRIWDAETGMQVGESLQGHGDWVQSVAFSHDGKRIVSGSDDKTIRIWDAETGTQVGDPLQGHTGRIFTIAMSPDGKHIVSGGGDDDCTIRVWDAETGTQVGEALQGHTSWVWSVAISPDGKRIVSGSGDRTIRIWDAEIGTQVGEPLRGHSDVTSVAISPDGKHIVSGSGDRTIRIWDLETGEQVGEPLQGHTGLVRSVAISPDGKRIVSGSVDDTVRIWNAEGILT